MLKSSLFASTAIVALSLAGAAWADCTEYDPFTAAVQNNAFEDATALYETLYLNPSCDTALRNWGARYLARENFIRGKKADDPAASEGYYEAALNYEEHWRTYAELGHLAWDRSDYNASAKYYQMSVNMLADGPAEHHATQEDIETVFDLASAAVALADGEIEVPKTRSGAPGGILVGSVRGFVVEEVSLPVTFLFGQTTFDEGGARFASLLADHLVEVGAKRVELSGHTDPIGDEDANMKLSLKRAKALEEFLVEQGFEGEISVQGFGETQPPQAVNGMDTDSQEFHRLSRRVVFKLG
ncbi:hypothetical protein ACMU_08930 [Actibacterium mucosum KCTC 23349]|uniref:OmpA-like domain-containing protein n=1 Tax=Actibacterium mucosum KCTC 23349 TaxID=1454373 RepID=A0A037ZK11_9RHOB|nr:OmpA family protein [Actibacterium mucosum]KAJ55882.1 hypothetical protein ACMU_08930 [Actibacterium mucosum KCTC 23349]